MRWLIGLVLCARVATADPFTNEVGRSFAGWHARAAADAARDPRDLGPWAVWVRITLAADGTLRDVVVIRPSRLPAYDDAALELVRGAVFPPPPPERVDPATGTYSFPWGFVWNGWQQPPYDGDAMLRARDTHGWLVESSVDVQTQSSGDTTLSRTTSTLAVAGTLLPRWLLEVELPVATVHYREPSSGTSTDVTGLGDAEIHAHRLLRYGNWTALLGEVLVLPTGRTLASPFAGATHPAIVDPGTGTLSIRAEACITRRPGDGARVDLCYSQRLPLYTRTSGYVAPTELDFSLLASVPLMCRHVLLTAGVVYDSLASVQDGTQPVEGHDELLAEASAWAVLYRGLAVRATVAVPLVDSVGPAELSDGFRVMGALSYDFDR